MKKLLLIAISVLTVALIAVSCSKSNDVRPAPSLGASLSGHSLVNEYDYMGKQHNEGLDFFLNKADLNNKPLDQAEPLTADFCAELGYNREEIAAYLRKEHVHNIIYSKSPATAVRDYLLAQGLEREAKYFDQMEAAFDNSPDAASTVEQLAKVEYAVMADKELERENQQTLLQGLAIGKYSAQYWYAEKLKGAESKWIIKTGTVGEPEPMAKPWWKIGLMDLAGALGGMGSGCPPCAVGAGVAASIVYGVE